MPLHVARKATIANDQFTKIPKYNMWAQNTSTQFNLVGEMTNILVDGTFAAPIEEIRARYMIGPQISAVTPRAGTAARVIVRAFNAIVERGPAGPISIAAHVGTAGTGGKDITVLVRDPMGPPVWIETETGKTSGLGILPSLDLRLAKEVIYKLMPGLSNFRTPRVYTHATVHWPFAWCKSSRSCRFWIVKARTGF